MDNMKKSYTQGEIEQSLMDRFDLEQFMELQEWIVKRIEAIKTYPEIQN